MKKIIALTVALVGMLSAFSQGTAIHSAGNKSISQAEIQKLKEKHNVDANYQKSKLPQSFQQQSAKPVSNVKPQTVTVSKSAVAPQAVPAAQPSLSAMSNEQRVALLNDHIAQNKAREESNKANAQKAVSAGSAKVAAPTTLKKPVSLKNRVADNQGK